MCTVRQAMVAGSRCIFPWPRTTTRQPPPCHCPRRLLRRRGYQVSGFTDPHEATAALRADPQRYDLLVTDYNMPGFCGVDLVREARHIRPDLPVALASGYVTAEIEQAAMAEGARALIHKPNDVEELCATVDRLVNGGS